ncbi:unnamed protein product [Rhizophagus irregularis]|nr:unnamed protein product [Rhizophagus irregularis]
MPISNNIRVVVGIDFGTTYSGFSFAHLSNSIIASNDKWPEQVPNTTKNDKIEYWDQIENLKTNTILGYDANFESVECWGPSAIIIPISDILQFTTEPEAAAIYCIDNISETEIYDYIGRSFLVVDCGGGTVDLTIRKLLKEYKAYELDIKKISPKLKQYVTKQHSNENRWTIKLAIQEEFKEQQISVPPRPIAAVARGAVSYGINEKFIKNRVLKYNYGRSTLRPYDENIDPIDRRRESGHVLVFKLLAKKGTVVDVDQKFSQTSHPENSDQEKMWYQILITERDDVRYPDEDGVIKLGDFIIDLPDAHLGKDRKVQFELCFGKMEIQAYAKNEHNGQEYEATFDYYDKDIAEISEILDEF